MEETTEVFDFSAVAAPSPSPSPAPEPVVEEVLVPAPETEPVVVEEVVVPAPARPTFLPGVPTPTKPFRLRFGLRNKM
jgi:hypothetical protein